MTSSHYTIVALLLWVSTTQSSTVKRQASQCSPPNTHRCDNGECIDPFSLCDGKIDCSDVSDETQEHCYTERSCSNAGFKCAYGACVDRRVICDGKPDCADSSDELLLQCPFSNITKTPSQCERNKRSCDSGECIDQFSFCDGQVNCQDGSDESISNCILINCRSSFRCAYGACIDRTLMCDGNWDCRDGSDEGPELCSDSPVQVAPPTVFPRPPTQPSSTTRPVSPSDAQERLGCKLPEQPENGKYTVHKWNDLSTFGLSSDLAQGIPGTNVPFDLPIFLNYSCNPGYVIDQGVDVPPPSICNQGSWTNNFKCEKPCPALNSTSLDLVCWYHSEEVNCNQPLRPTSVVKPKCKIGYELVNFNEAFSTTYCDEQGQWDRPLFSCRSVCGIAGVNPDPLISWGFSSNVGQFPWHIALYRLENNTYPYKCGGTIINEYAVLTAAHCLYDSARNAILPPEEFRVIAGKYWRDYERKETHEVRLNVTEILTPTHYNNKINNYEGDMAILVLSSPLHFSQYVTPICIDWDLTLDALKGQKGLISGWGLNEDQDLNEQLVFIEMAYLDVGTCYNATSVYFQQFIWHDKFCGVYDDGAGVQPGDSGGGYLVKRDGIYFIAGIVSARESNNNELATFTNIILYFPWLRNVTNELETRFSISK